MPRSVLDACAERARLGVHALKGRFRSARTLLVWRREAPQGNVALLAEVLAPRTRRPQHARGVRSR